MKKFICIANCPELDIDKISHCVDTEEGIQRRIERVCDYCPCGNTEKWKELE